MLSKGEKLYKKILIEMLIATLRAIIAVIIVHIAYTISDTFLSGGIAATLYMTIMGVIDICLKNEED